MGSKSFRIRIQLWKDKKSVAGWILNKYELNSCKILTKLLAIFRFQISDFRFQISDFRFQTSDFRLLLYFKNENLNVTSLKEYWFLHECRVGGRTENLEVHILIGGLLMKLVLFLYLAKSAGAPPVLRPYSVTEPLAYLADTWAFRSQHLIYKFGWNKEKVLLKLLFKSV